MTYHHSSSLKVRSRVFNLKDKKNRGLREGLLLVIPGFNTLGLNKKSVLLWTIHLLSHIRFREVLPLKD